LTYGAMEAVELPVSATMMLVVVVNTAAPKFAPAELTTAVPTV